MKPRKASKKTVPEDAPIETEVVPETFTLPPTTLATPATIIIPDQVPASNSSPLKASSSFDANSLGVPYSLPSGITVTEKTLSQREEPVGNQ
ncbi:hypothetical protein LIER_30600 [Lithospermum erythrorhizon]|uniref:Uncharacterized protein n=1 Tax=Lithospermum erythrorhizon TaxID=34254 RepID=A0AAV3RNT0_LITER